MDPNAILTSAPLATPEQQDAAAEVLKAKGYTVPDNTVLGQLDKATPEKQAEATRVLLEKMRPGNVVSDAVSDYASNVSSMFLGRDVSNVPAGVKPFDIPTRGDVFNPESSAPKVDIKQNVVDSNITDRIDANLEESDTSAKTAVGRQEAAISSITKRQADLDKATKDIVGRQEENLRQADIERKSTTDKINATIAESERFRMLYETMKPKDFWANKSTGDKIAMGLAIAFGAGAQVMSGGERGNSGLTAIQSAIQADKDAFKEEQAKILRLHEMAGADAKTLLSKLNTVNATVAARDTQYMNILDSHAKNMTSQVNSEKVKAELAKASDDIIQHKNNSANTQLNKLAETTAMTAKMEVALDQLPDSFKKSLTAGQSLKVAETMVNAGYVTENGDYIGPDWGKGAHDISEASQKQVQFLVTSEPAFKGMEDYERTLEGPRAQRLINLVRNNLASMAASPNIAGMEVTKAFETFFGKDFEATAARELGEGGPAYVRRLRQVMISKTRLDSGAAIKDGEYLNELSRIVPTTADTESYQAARNFRYDTMRASQIMLNGLKGAQQSKLYFQKTNAKVK